MKDNATLLLILAVALIIGVMIFLPKLLRALMNKGSDAVHNARVRAHNTSNGPKIERLADRYPNLKLNPSGTAGAGKPPAAPAPAVSRPTPSPAVLPVKTQPAALARQPAVKAASLPEEDEEWEEVPAPAARPYAPPEEDEEWEAISAPTRRLPAAQPAPAVPATRVQPAPSPAVSLTKTQPAKPSPAVSLTKAQPKAANEPSPRAAAAPVRRTLSAERCCLCGAPLGPDACGLYTHPSGTEARVDGKCYAVLNAAATPGDPYRAAAGRYIRSLLGTADPFTDKVLTRFLRETEAL